MDYDLQRLGSREFEHMTQALALAVLGPGVQVFGDGRDGGREATFEGRYPHPSHEPGQVWNGYGVLQAKFHQVREEVGQNETWLVGQLKDELRHWSDPNSKRVKDGRLPEYLLVATNVRLSAVPKAGGVDTVSRTLDDFARKLGIKGWDLWHYDKIRAILDDQPRIRQTYDHMITPGDVLARVMQLLSETTPEFGKVVVGQVARDLLAQQWVKLSEVGHYDNQKLTLGRVAVDLPVEIDYEGETKSDTAVQHIIGCGDAVLRSSRNPEQLRGLVLVGGSGQGKTTLGQLLCQIYRAALLIEHTSLPPAVLDLRDQFLAEMSQIGLPVPAARRWPIHVRLTEFADRLAEDPNLSLLAHVTCIVGADADERLTPVTLKNWLRTWPWFLVLDGLDEVADQRIRDELLRKVQNFEIDAAQADADLLTVVTTRPQGYAEDVPVGTYPHVRLRPLAPEEAIRYAERLTVERHREDPAFAREIISRFHAALHETATAHLMRSPLQVAILSLLLERRPIAPRSRHALFQAFYAAVFDREVAKNTAEARFLDQHRRHVDALHEWAGLALQCRSEREGDAGATLTVGELEALARKRLNIERFPEKLAAGLALDLVSVAENRLVLLQRTENRFGFEVRSLQEFMAAKALVDGKDGEVLDRLSALAPSAHWRNTWLLAADRIFTEREALRGDLLHWLKNADFANRLALTVLPGARLAVELLEDGVALSSPAHEQALTKHALDLLHTLPDRSTPYLADVLRPYAEPGNHVDRMVRETAGAGPRELSALLVLACWANDPGLAASATARLKEIKAGMTPAERHRAATLAADYPVRLLRDMVSREVEVLDESTLGALLRVTSGQALETTSAVLESVKTWQEKRGELIVRRVDRSVLPELSRLDEALTDEGAVDGLLDAAEMLPAPEWPLASELHRILGAWQQRRPAGDLISHPAIDPSPSS
ncbi:MAG: NACHT domain-containing protein [Actinoallomurus sp.]